MSRSRHARPSEADRKAVIAAAQAAADRREFRALEHRIDVATRLCSVEITHGLRWREQTDGKRHACMGCRRPACRRWVGFWFEFEIAPGVMPYAIAQTVPLCAVCVAQRQDREKYAPIWRPRDWRAARAA